MKTLILAISLLPMLGNAQNPVSGPNSRDALIQLTNDYFDAYNKCDVEKMMAFNSEDIEIYTDFAGTTFGQSAVRQQIKNFCSYTSALDKPTIGIGILGDLNTYVLLTKDDKVYGAVVQGKLTNYTINKQSGAKDEDGTNDFYWILRYDSNKWLISRDISYNFQR